MESDRLIYKDMDISTELIASGKLLEAVEKAVGELF
jgi:hypothetical protein